MEAAGSVAVLQAFAESPERAAFEREWAAMPPAAREVLVSRARKGVLSEPLAVGGRSVGASERAQMVVALVPEVRVSVGRGGGYTYPLSTSNSLYVLCVRSMQVRGHLIPLRSPPPFMQVRPPPPPSPPL